MLTKETLELLISSSFGDDRRRLMTEAFSVPCWADVKPTETCGRPEIPVPPGHVCKVLSPRVWVEWEGTMRGDIRSPALGSRVPLCSSLPLKDFATTPGRDREASSCSFEECPLLPSPHPYYIDPILSPIHLSKLQC